ncbi:MAG: hypothetical protein JSS99_04515 [Actinobacteria bacterium]|nr:hypothetical protein [Actinomycetota bacterium]
MRRRVVIVPLLALAGLLLARRLRRRRAAGAPLAARPPQPALAPTAAPDAPGSRFVSVPWTLVEAPADEPSLAIRYRSDEHMELDRIDAQETPTQVFVTVLTRWSPPAGGWVALGREQDAVVRLSAPLGARELVHAAVDGEEPGEPPLYP